MWRRLWAATEGLLLRQSGTEPLIRVMVEAESTGDREKYVDQVIGALRKKGHAVS